MKFDVHVNTGPDIQNLKNLAQWNLNTQKRKKNIDSLPFAK